MTDPVNGSYNYAYHKLNEEHGYNKIPKNTVFNTALSYGGGAGLELEPIIGRINDVYIVEPSKKFRNLTLGNKQITYSEPDIYGKVKFEDEKFDIITCFGVLMYIPNVSFVFSELYRCLKPGGYLLIREPVSDMHYGTLGRVGCGKNTRGLPLCFLKQLVGSYSFSKAETTLCIFSPLSRALGKFGFGVYNSKNGVKLDRRLCNLFAGNYKYSRETFIAKFSPGSAFLFLKK